MREASTRLYVEFQVDQNLISASPDAYYGECGTASSVARSNVLPTEFSFAAGVGF